VFAHYFKVARRTFAKNKSNYGINLIGLVSGTLTALIIAKYLGFSLSYDDFHENKEKIFLVHHEESTDDLDVQSLTDTYWGTGEVIKESFPEVAKITRYGGYLEKLVMTTSENGELVKFNENKIRYVDSNFLTIFTYPMIYGDPQTSLSKVNSVVLTKSTSKKYFGEIIPIGKVLTTRVSWGTEEKLTVTGVIEDIPKNSTLQFDFLVSQSPPETAEYWTSPSYRTYLLINKQTEPDLLAEKLSKEINQISTLSAAGKKINLKLESIASVRLNSNEYILALVGLFILIITWINYLNISAAQAYSRLQEIGVLSIMGASRFNFIMQFSIETCLLNVIAIMLIGIGYALLEPSMQAFTHYHLLPLFGDGGMINFFFVIIFLVGSIAAIGLQKVILNTEKALQSLSNGEEWKTRVGLRRILVIVQFCISATLIISIFVIASQLDYMKNQDKKFDASNILILKAPKDTWDGKVEKLRSFKHESNKFPFILSTAISTTVPGEEYRHEIFLSLPGKEEKTLVHANGIDAHFLELYDVPILAGNNFSSHNISINSNGIILSKAAAELMGMANFNDAINSKIIDHESRRPLELIGIVDNYHKTSLKYEIKPMAFRFNAYRGHLSLKLSSSHLPEHSDMTNNIALISELWSTVYPDQPFDYFFLKDKILSQDEADVYFGKLFGFATVLSIIISCLGLFGLSLFLSRTQRREIAIRKVFGASSLNILKFLTKGYLSQLLIAIIIGAPSAYFLMRAWLRNYTYRVDIQFWLVCLAIFILTSFFLATVSYHTYSASIANPTKTLREK
jgi:putative ABC transport system permease protein